MKMSILKTYFYFREIKQENAWAIFAAVQSFVIAEN